MTGILGIDPGLAACGYGLILSDGSRYQYKDHGTISTTSGMRTGERLKIIHDAIIQLIDRYQPEAAGIEGLFFARNVTSAIPVAQARGVILLALEERSIPVFDIQPQEIKRSLAGNGRADKAQIQEMVRLLLGLDAVPKPDHAADALAAAICCGSISGFTDRLERSAHVQ